MKLRTNKFLHFLVVFLSVSMTTLPPASADELTELYLGSSSDDTSSEIGANILILLDTSGSMTKHGVTELGFTVDPEAYWGGPYDSTRTYPGPCDPGMAYRHSINTDRDLDGDIDIDDAADEDFEECDGEQHFPLSAMACEAVLVNGVAVDRFGEYRPRTPGPDNDYEFNGKDLNGEWESMNDSFNGVASIGGDTVWRECADDFGVHGIPGSLSDVYKWPADDGDDFGWTAFASSAKSLASENRQLVATGNYINYFRWSQTRLAAVQTALKEVIAELPPETRVGVMRFDVKIEEPLDENSSDGAYMIKEFVELGENTLDAGGNTVISANRQALIDRLYEIDPADDGGTPLGESLFEALQVFRGGTVMFGADAETWNIDTGVWPWDENTTDYLNVSSVMESRKDGMMSYQYESPIIFECQKSAVIFLSDGDPDGDTGTDELFDNLPHADDYGAVGCDDDGGSDSCIREVADYMAHEDLSSLTGEQTVTTYTVGFGTDISAAGAALLTEAAELGGGYFTQVTNYEDLKHAFQVILRQEIADNQSLSSPAVTVNAFNRLAHENELYFTMFDPVFDSVHWPGNVKKYKLKKIDGSFRIVDVNGQPALAEGSSDLAYDALSFWTDPDDPAVFANQGNDGNKTRLGGAAGELTDARLDSRNLYTWLGTSGSLAAAGNAFHASNTRITRDHLGLDASATAMDRENVINYMRGVDLKDEDQDGSTTDARRAMGAAPHGVPAIVTYGEDEATSEQVVYAPTNDGFLHAIDAEDGHELWSFVPVETMHNFAGMYATPDTPYIGYGIDGSIVHYTDTSSGSKREWLFFGMRRGGKSLYALDVTDRNSPKVLWRIQGGDPEGDGAADDEFFRLAQTWSDPEVAHVRLGADDTDGTPVLIFGGGYDATTQDSDAADSGYVDDTAGNAIFIVRASDGELLWSASPAGGSLAVAGMKSSITAGIEIQDKNGDGLDDLFYAADLGGRIFRFDIDNSANTGSTLSITGGMIASLGANGVSGSLAINRKFFNKLDAVLVAKDGLTYRAINIGSGDRERPKSNMATINYVFSVKDRDVFTVKNDYSDVITIDELYDVTSNPIQDGEDSEAARAELNDADGWKLKLENSGEKALAEATTFDFKVFFTTFDPVPLETGSCNSDPGRARLYSLDLLTAGAAGDNNGDGEISKEDRVTDLTHGTIPPGVTIMFIEDENGNVEATTIIGRSDDKPNLGKSSNVRRTYWHIKSRDGKEQ